MIGIDIVRISRIRNLINRKGILFAQKMIGSNANSAETLAGHFAAKEAYSKAVGKGLTKEFIQKSFVDYSKNGRPFLNYNGKRFLVSISHDGDYAIASVNIKDMIADEFHLNMLNHRPQESNKSTFGRLAIIAGCNNMPGSATLATNSAFRVGAGYVYLYSSNDMLDVLQIKNTEAIIKNIDSFSEIMPDAIAIGPGIGFNLDDKIVEIFKFIEKNQIPTIIDADGFYYLKKHNLNTRLVVTPHPKEASRLLDVSLNDVMNNREEAAREISKKYNTICLLKGYKSLIADQNNNIIVNTTGSNALATAGTGDVLTGIIGGFLAQGMDIKTSAIAGAYFHGLAADIFSNKYSKRSMKSGDLIDMLKFVFRGEDDA